MEGYAKTARLMATHDEFAIFRRFKLLNYQQLLYQQAEIVYLHDTLSKVVRRDAGHPDRTTYERNWWDLAHGKGREGREQWRKVKRLRKKLNKYNDALLKQAFLAKLDCPNKQDLDFLRSWFERPRMGCFPIRGLDRSAWESEHEDDLVAVKPRSTPDTLSRWFTNLIFPLFHRLYGERIKGGTSDPEPGELGLGEGIYTYRESRLAAIVDVTVTVVASLLPLLSSVALFLLRTDALKLGVTVVFSACFALALALMTSARRIEVFAATAAFAAVNVVFLTNTGC